MLPRRLRCRAGPVQALRRSPLVTSSPSADRFQARAWQQGNRWYRSTTECLFCRMIFTRQWLDDVDRLRVLEQQVLGNAPDARAAVRDDQASGLDELLVRKLQKGRAAGRMNIRCVSTGRTHCLTRSGEQKRHVLESSAVRAVAGAPAAAARTRLSEEDLAVANVNARRAAVALRLA